MKPRDRGAGAGPRAALALVAHSPDDVSAQTTLALLQRQLGAAHAKWATKPEERAAAPRDHWLKARDNDRRSLAVYESLRRRARLGGADTGKPDELAGEIAACDLALSAAG